MQETNFKELLSESDRKCTAVEEGLNTLNSIVMNLDENIRNIQKENINIFVACHNFINKSNPITNDHIAGLFKEQSKIISKLPSISNLTNKKNNISPVSGNNTKQKQNAVHKQ